MSGMGGGGGDLNLKAGEFPFLSQFSSSLYPVTKNILLTVSSFSSPTISLPKPLPSLLFLLWNQAQIHNCTFSCLLDISTWTFNKHLKLNASIVGCFISSQNCSLTGLPHLCEWQLHSSSWLDQNHKSSLSAFSPTFYFIHRSSPELSSKYIQDMTTSHNLHYSKQVQATISVFPCLDYCNSLLNASSLTFTHVPYTIIFMQQKDRFKAF